MTLNTLAQHVKQAATGTRGKAAGGAALLMGSAAAHAQEATSGAAAAFSEIQSTGSDMVGYAWPVVASITAALIGIKLFKKFANRAS
ncbi:major coat protein [Vreelandella zhanjiangensis]|uniref:major coat protein n=1 Tax=Vreelandella zhanjiangensis TaxID=1121960 RepID=UPI00036EBE1B|nr:major coat protein [Halomonas zhanjiangensis]